MGAIGATISGAGPSVLVWTFWQSTGEVMKKLTRAGGGLGRGAAGAVLADRRGRAGAVSPDDGSSLSLWSEDSFLSIASKGSALSIGSVGSFASIGSIGSAGSAFSVASAGSAGSVMSFASAGSVLSARARDSILGDPERSNAGLLSAGILARLRRRDRRLGDLHRRTESDGRPAAPMDRGARRRIAPLRERGRRAPYRCWSSTVWSLSCSRRSRTSCPCCWASASCGCFFAFLPDTACWLCGTPPLSAELRTGKAAGDTEAGHEHRQLARSHLHVRITSVAGLVSPTEKATEGARGLRPSQSSKPTWRRIETESE